MPTPVSSTVAKTFAILKLFSRRSAVTTACITEELGYPHSTAYRLLTGLVSVGVLEQPARDRYVLSLSLFELGALAPTRRQLSNRARRPLESLTAETGLPTNMGALHDDKVVLLETVTGRLFSVPTRVGNKAPIHSTALGKLLLANSDDGLLDRVCAKPLYSFTPRSMVTRQALETEISAIRANDFAQEIEETHRGGACVAVPIRLNGDSIAGISISAPAATFSSMRESYLRSLRRTAREIERGAGWQSALVWPLDGDRAATG